MCGKTDIGKCIGKLGGAFRDCMQTRVKYIERDTEGNGRGLILFFCRGISMQRLRTTIIFG
jgi:hypothetical protein